MLPLLYVGLYFQLGAALPTTPADTHRQEVALLHRAIDLDRLRDFDVWDERAAEWRKPKSDELTDDRAAVLLLHFWASWCKPCREEFPIWRELQPRLEALYQGKVRIVYVAIQTNNADMERFLMENKDRMPRAPWYLDVGERLAGIVRAGLPEDRLPMPVTLWLDRQRVVRQAVAGSIYHRRAEVVDSTARLVRLSDQLGDPARAMQPAKARASSGK